MVSCHDAMLDLSSYLDGKLPPERAREIELHLAGCERCPSVFKIGDTWVLQERAVPTT